MIILQLVFLELLLTNSIIYASTTTILFRKPSIFCIPRTICGCICYESIYSTIIYRTICNTDVHYKTIVVSPFCFFLTSGPFPFFYEKKRNKDGREDKNKGSMKIKVSTITIMKRMRTVRSLLLLFPFYLSLQQKLCPPGKKSADLFIFLRSLLFLPKYELTRCFLSFYKKKYKMLLCRKNGIYLWRRIRKEGQVFSKFSVYE